MLRNFEGVITTYPEPENYVPGRADGYFKEIFQDYEEKKSNIGIAGLMTDQQFNLIPEGLLRISKRKQYGYDPAHSSLKDKREKRDELKEKKFQAQQQRSVSTGQGNDDIQESTIESSNVKGVSDNE